MKKSLLLILASLFAIFALAGCAEEENDAPALIQPTLSNVSSLNGTYDIEFFYVNAVIAALTTDCSKVEEYASGETQCRDNATDSVQHYGQATITVNPDGSVKVFSKIQINGGVFDQTEGLINKVAADKRYNFTEYKTIPASAINETAVNDSVNDSTVAFAVTGTYGRSADKLVEETKSVNNTFTFTVEPDGTVVNVLTDVTVMPANTIVRMKKVSNDVIALDPNTAYETPVIDNFDAEAGRYEIKNN